MKWVFADAFYFIAFLNRRDPAHSRTVNWMLGYHGSILTSEWILLELADGLATTPLRPTYERYRRRLLGNPRFRIIGFDNSIYDEALQLYDARPDKKWSLTDCTSFVIMRREGLKDALTGDHHFEQAGFVSLLKSP